MLVYNMDFSRILLKLSAKYDDIPFDTWRVVRAYCKDSYLLKIGEHINTIKYEKIYIERIVRPWFVEQIVTEDRMSEHLIKAITENRSTICFGRLDSGTYNETYKLLEVFNPQDLMEALNLALLTPIYNNGYDIQRGTKMEFKIEAVIKKNEVVHLLKLTRGF